MRTNKIILSTLFALFATIATAQTLNVHTGYVNTAVTASEDKMYFSDSGNTVTICDKEFSINDIDSINIDNIEVSDNTINVAYDGDHAYVTVAGNIAKYITANVSGAHVSIVQSADVTEELTYTLEGSSSDGSFWMDGELKITLVLNGLTLTCADSAAINIRDGKRIAVELADGTVNTLVDGADGSHKGCFIVNGHAEFQGGGDLYLTGNTKHAFFGDEYVELKKSTGTITVLGAVKDGFNINQYFEMKGGVVTISNIGDDGVQVSYTDDDDDEQNGQVIISGGELDIAITAAASKGIKCDDIMTVSDGVINITTSGTGSYDSSERDVSSCAAIKADGTLTISGGTFTLKSTGKGGKGISSDSDIIISGGTFDVTTTGAKYSYSSYTALAKGIKADGDITISDGDITIATTGGEGSEGLESKGTLTISGGDIVIDAYDDAINAATKISISGGRVFACSTNNDGIDSNGTMYLSGGLILASGTTTPEAAFDTDEGTFSITGGTIIGLGGDATTPTSSATTQPVLILTGGSYTQGKYIAFNASDGTNIFTYLIPQSYSSGTLTISSPEMSKGSSYTVQTGVTVSGGTEWEGYSDDATISGGSTLKTVSLSSTITTSTISSSGGNNGGPGGNNGGFGGFGF